MLSKYTEKKCSKIAIKSHENNKNIKQILSYTALKVIVIVSYIIFSPKVIWYTYVKFNNKHVFNYIIYLVLHCSTIIFRLEVFGNLPDA